jgi:ferritin-like metal-binding protein YciE
MASKNAQDMVLSWLNDAYGMEKAIVQILENQVKDAENYPQAQARLQQHLDATKQHAEAVKGCIERLGGSTSSIKSGLSSLFGQVQAMSTGAAEDEMIKNAISDFGVEHFEMASYMSLIAAAQEIGDTQTVTTCQSILQDEQEMAAWLQQNIGPMTIEVLGKVAGASSSS